MPSQPSSPSPWRLLLGVAARVAPLMPEPDDRRHFVRDYRRFVRTLRARYPLDQAMSLAVGGHYVEMGERLADILQEVTNLGPGQRLLDLGCGSGRLPTALSRRMAIDYTGIDIIPELLAYARTKSPPGYRFILSRTLTLPLPSDAFDMVCAFSLFTHLKHEETYAYLAEARRTLRPGGVLICSFLEFAEPDHWRVFEETLDAALREKQGHANVFIERTVLELWAERLGFSPPTFYRNGDAGAAGGLGQSVAVMTSP